MRALRHGGLLALVCATLVFYVVLMLPNHPASVGWGLWRVFPLELPVIMLGLVALSGTALAKPLRLLLAVVLTLIVILKCADFVSYNALSRPFNPVSDFPLVEAFVRLLIGTLGAFIAGVTVLLALLAIIAFGSVVWWATGVWARLGLSSSSAKLAGFAAVLATGLAIADIGHTMGRWDLGASPPGVALTSRIAVERSLLMRKTVARLHAFKKEVAEDPYAEKTGLLSAIDRDVLVVFVESYGRTSFDTPLYAKVHRETLQTYQARLRGLGLSMRSGFLISPTSGGQSWLAHATFSNGLWIDNQVSYAAALSSGRQTLFHHASRSGFRTATVMPQITLEWPESKTMGFEKVLVSKDLGYRGPSFNWVTMPDQFTLSALDRLVRDGSDKRNQFAQVVLVSSHAPWVPVASFLPWDSVGDGSVFSGMAASGDAPEVVWRDRDRVRTQYRAAVDYALKTVFEYAVLHAANPPLILVVGDHQAAGFVALDNRPHVPIHVIGPEALTSALSQAAPYRGLLPPDDAAATPMNAMRNLMLEAFSPKAHGLADN
ncbi:MAG: sulfatase [Pseudomonadota bacterium]